MKKFIHTLFGEEIKEFKTLNRKQKAVYIYFVASLVVFLIGSCCVDIHSFASFIPLCIIMGNLINALRLGIKYIPNFRIEDC